MQGKNQWRCMQCQYPKCHTCGKQLTEVWHKTRGHSLPYCSEGCEKVRCVDCKVLRAGTDFAETVRKKPKNQWRCLKCQYPPCHKCSKKLTTTFIQKGNNAMPYCLNNGERCKYPPCAGAGKRKCNKPRPRMYGYEWHNWEGKGKMPWQCKICKSNRRNS